MGAACGMATDAFGTVLEPSSLPPNDKALVNFDQTRLNTFGSSLEPSLLAAALAGKAAVWPDGAGGGACLRDAGNCL